MAVEWGLLVGLCAGVTTAVGVRAVGRDEGGLGGCHDQAALGAWLWYVLMAMV